jgi:Spy/CpxP family protein refolding chaperone
MIGKSTKAEKVKALDALVAEAKAKEKIIGFQIPAAEGSIEDDFILPPEPTADMFYGIVGKVAEIAADKTEVNPVAAATAFMSFLAANMGRDTFLHIANTYHHPRLFTMHIGRSGRGRKGDSQQITLRIRQQIENLDKKLLGQLHTGGLSSREGLASLIQDAQGDKTGIDDKRLWVVESEFSNVLHQTKRDGNTLSSSLRDAWDGGDIKPAVKNGRTWVSAPHVGIHANITPNELKGLLTSREMNNGFANRFLFIWSESIAEVAFPQATPEHIIDELARETIGIISFGKGKYPDTQNSHEMSLSAAAKEYYADIYPTIRRPLASEFITSLLERRAPYLLRLAMLFALTDRTRVIEPNHLKAALAWINYAVHSVRYIFQDQARSAGDEDIKRNAEKIVAFLGNHPQGCTLTAIANDCFKKHLAADKIQKALGYLLTDIPKRIERIEIKNQNPGRKPVFYRKIVADNCGQLQSQTRRGLETVL